jgi:hypothetical protein
VVQRGVEEALIALREIFKREPSIAPEMLNLLDLNEKFLRDPTERRRFRGLIQDIPRQEQQILGFLRPSRNI